MKEFIFVYCHLWMCDQVSRMLHICIMPYIYYVPPLFSLSKLLINLVSFIFVILAFLLLSFHMWKVLIPVFSLFFLKSNFAFLGWWILCNQQLVDGPCPNCRSSTRMVLCYCWYQFIDDWYKDMKLWKINTKIL